jgi:hypothetical protein
MKTTFNEAVKHNNTTTFEGKQYSFLWSYDSNTDANVESGELTAVVMGEDNKLYYATFDCDDNKQLDEQNYDEAIEMTLIGSFSRWYDEFECDYDED